MLNTDPQFWVSDTSSDIKTPHVRIMIKNQELAWPMPSARVVQVPTLDHVPMATELAAHLR